MTTFSALTNEELISMARTERYGLTVLLGERLAAALDEGTDGDSHLTEANDELESVKTQRADELRRIEGAVEALTIMIGEMT